MKSMNLNVNVAITLQQLLQNFKIEIKYNVINVGGKGTPQTESLDFLQVAKLF